MKNVAEKPNLNGTAKNSEKPNDVKKLTDNPIPSETLNTPPPPSPLTVVGSIGDRLKKVALLNALAQRREGIETGQKRLAKFSHGSDANSSKIVLKDANGEVFETANSETIAAVLDCMNHRGNAELQKVDELIMNINF